MGAPEGPRRRRPSAVKRPPGTPPCPTCRGPVPPAGEAFPFCSSRCRTIDLGRWLGEEYRIPAVEDEDEDGGSTSQEPTPAGAPTPAPPGPTPPWRN